MTTVAEQADRDDVTLDDVAELIQRWITQQAGEPVVVTGAMLVWEKARYTENGDQARAFGYADILHSGLAAAIGLLVAGKRQVMDDLFGDPEEDDDDDE